MNSLDATRSLTVNTSAIRFLQGEEKTEGTKTAIHLSLKNRG